MTSINLFYRCVNSQRGFSSDVVVIAQHGVNWGNIAVYKYGIIPVAINEVIYVV